MANPTPLRREFRPGQRLMLQTGIVDEVVEANDHHTVLIVKTLTRSYEVVLDRNGELVSSRVYPPVSGTKPLAPGNGALPGDSGKAQR